MNFCPVCGYAVPYPPADFHICPSCGTEFGYDDSGTTYEELRNQWIRDGLAWWSPVDRPPENWDPYQQMMRGIVLNNAGTFTGGSQGFYVEGTSFLAGYNSVPLIATNRKRPTGAHRTVSGAIAHGGRGR